MSRRHPNVVNLDEAEPFVPPGERPAPFAGAARRLGAAAGGRGLGCTHFRVPAGATAVPFHAHHVNEEAIFVLDGEGTLRVGDERVAVRTGDWIALPPGDAHAHQLWADRGVELAYLCVSTMTPVEIVTYPDSRKLLAAVGGFGQTSLRKMFWQSDGDVPYFAGEGEDAGGAGAVPPASGEER